METILVTGGAGFIGSNFIRYLLNTYQRINVCNLDKLTYAGNPKNLSDFDGHPRYKFIKGDIGDRDLVDHVLKKCRVVVNFAAETHVDRSLDSDEDFLNTNIRGVNVLLKASLRNNVRRFIQISTDEVYGSRLRGSFKETDMLNPSSPYSSSKAAGDLLSLSYWKTSKLPVIITRSTNNFGPFQFPEKVIPLFITNALENKPLPLYGDGLNMRDWLFVLDNCAAIDLVMRRGIPGEVYNIGVGLEKTNKELTRTILQLMGKPKTLIHKVSDRPGHDRRYSVDCTKIKRMGWKPSWDFVSALTLTVDWYSENVQWWDSLKKKGAFKSFYRRWYKGKN